MPNKSRLLAPLLLVAALAGACIGDPAPPASGDPDGTSMVIAVAEEPADVNPLSGFAENGAAKLFDGLVEHEADLALRPALAVDLPVPAADGRSWTVRLRSNVTFADGSPLEVDDVVGTYRAMLDPARKSPVRGRFPMLKSVSAVNAATVRFDLTAPYAPFPELLVLGIVSSESVTTEKPVGTGPYRLESWTRGKQMVLAANASYWAGPPAIKNVTVEFIPDDDVRAARLRDGKLDGAALPPPLAAGFEDTDGLLVAYHSAADVRAVVLPAGNPVTGDLDVRLALNHAVDRETMVEDAVATKARVAHTPMPNVLAEFVDPDATFEFDVTTALDTLSSGGWVPGEAGVRTKNGVPASFTLRYPAGDTVSAALAQSFAADARAIGVDVTPEPATTEGTGPSVVRFGDPFDPDLELYRLVHSGSALGGYGDDAVDDAVETGRSSTDPAERATAYRKFQRSWVNAPGMAVLVAPNHTYVMRESWDGYEPVVDAAGSDFTWGAWWNLETWTPQ
ncbi:MAG: ABC transporter substrate-binding protein [Actinophytocola sp.]|uniref:ABC transporter substrate-binding protein n=1 Tax=Actinophytocola sp. TaxID=1872138 RepID=UPI003C74920B